MTGTVLRRLCITALLAWLAVGSLLPGVGMAWPAASGTASPAACDGCGDDADDACARALCTWCSALVPAAAILPDLDQAVASAAPIAQGRAFVPAAPTPPPRPLRLS